MVHIALKELGLGVFCDSGMKKNLVGVRVRFSSTADRETGWNSVGQQPWWVC